MSAALILPFAWSPTSPILCVSIFFPFMVPPGEPGRPEGAKTLAFRNRKRSAHSQRSSGTRGHLENREERKHAFQAPLRVYGNDGTKFPENWRYCAR